MKHAIYISIILILSVFVFRSHECPLGFGGPVEAPSSPTYSLEDGDYFLQKDGNGKITVGAFKIVVDGKEIGGIFSQTELELLNQGAPIEKIVAKYVLKKEQELNEYNAKPEAEKTIVEEAGDIDSQKVAEEKEKYE